MIPLAAEQQGHNLGSEAPCKRHPQRCGGGGSQASGAPVGTGALWGLLLWQQLHLLLHCCVPGPLQRGQQGRVCCTVQPGEKLPLSGAQ